MRKSIVSMTSSIARLSEDRGVTSVEYGLMVALIAVAIIGAVGLLGTNLSTLFTSIANTI
ncbi:MAG TPA: Flp family type IVb pilin [Streptosporangiaceae bacterium]